MTCDQTRTGTKEDMLLVHITFLHFCITALTDQINGIKGRAPSPSVSIYCKCLAVAAVVVEIVIGGVVAVVAAAAVIMGPMNPFPLHLPVTWVLAKCRMF